LMFVDKIILRHEENSFSFSFSAFEFISPAAVEYHYRLKDFETDWHKTNSLQRVATYTNLNAGLYTFQVKSSSVLSVRESKIVEITIQILPPWWKTWWAYVIYVTIFVGLLGLYLKIMRRQYILQQDFFVERVKHDKDIETSRMKLNFFTNITHEFRTPLTLILGPLEKLMDDFQHNQELRTELNVIQRNAQRLLDLINEILDFRKLEESSLQLKLGNHDIVRFVQLVALKFESHARLHNIAFHITHIPAPVMLMFDQTKLEKVLYNLFSNAFKFTPDGGRIECRISIDKNDLSEKGADMLLIEIEDNGSGIRKDEIGHIFERYFSGESRNTNFHTGIGLALSKEIIDLHKGVILARNNAANGACFTLKLPVSFQYITKEPIVDEIFVEKTNNLLNFEEPFLQNDAYYNTNTDADKKIILVVEDNDDIRNFVKHSFNDEYKVIEATNGEDALVVALEAIPDLIITDIMMPQMDGTVLCKTLKNDDRTSHIPIIIITALSELESRIQCIELGADSYIPKPFHLKHLQARVRQLIGLRVTLQQKYSENITKVHPNENMTVAVEQIKSADEIFLERTALIIEKKLGDSEFNLNALCLELGMKHPQLYRKVKALTGMSIKDFILSIRMKNATQLLLTGNFNIAEVGYMVGFSSPAYFTETFKKHFGQTPSDYLKTGDPDCS
ncbi:MAG: hypothetical protein RIS47_2372, partial [Bacteroidota bacterium]